MFKNKFISKHQNKTIEERRVISLMNYMAFLAIFICILLEITSTLLIGFNYPRFFSVILAVCVFLIIVYLNYLGKEKYSKYLFVVIINLGVYMLYFFTSYKLATWIVIMAFFPLYVGVFLKKESIYIPAIISLILGGLLIYYQSLPTHKSYVLFEDRHIVRMQIIYFVCSSFLIMGTMLFIKANISEHQNKLTKLLNERTLLVKEIHHRVKNNLQVISGLLQLQSNKYKNPKIAEIINDSQRQINSIALVHEMLYKDANLSLISLQKYLEELGNSVLQVSTLKNISLKINTNNITLSIDQATTLGLLLNELISNSLKHAFKTDKGQINVVLLQKDDKRYQFIYNDDGVGMNLGLIKKPSKSLGLKLIKMFSEEIDAEIDIKSKNGLTYTLTFNSN